MGISTGSIPHEKKDTDKMPFLIDLICYCSVLFFLKWGPYYISHLIRPHDAHKLCAYVVVFIVHAQVDRRIPILKGLFGRICSWKCDQWEFQDPKMEVPTIYKAYIRPM